MSEKALKGIISFIIVCGIMIVCLPINANAVGFADASGNRFFKVESCKAALDDLTVPYSSWNAPTNNWVSSTLRTGNYGYTPDWRIGGQGGYSSGTTNKLNDGSTVHTWPMIWNTNGQGTNSIQPNPPCSQDGLAANDSDSPGADPAGTHNGIFIRTSRCPASAYASGPWLSSIATIRTEPRCNAQTHTGDLGGISYNIGDPASTGKEINASVITMQMRTAGEGCITLNGCFMTTTANGGFGIYAQQTQWKAFGQGFTNGTTLSNTANSNNPGYFTQDPNGATTLNQTKCKSGGYATTSCAGTGSAAYGSNCVYQSNVSDCWTQSVNSSGAYGYAKYTKADMGISTGQQWAYNYQIMCATNSDAQGFDYSNSTDTRSCYSGDPVGTDYVARAAVRGQQAYIQDNTDPVLSNIAGPLWNSNAVSGNLTDGTNTGAISFDSSDNSGIAVIGSSIWNTAHTVSYGSPLIFTGNACPAATNASDNYTSITPCNNSWNGANFNTTSLSDGTYSVAALAIDPAGRQTTQWHNVIIDNHGPDGTNCAPPTVTAPTPIVGTWVKGTVTVTGTGCALSGVTASVIQASVNGGAWFNSPSCSGGTSVGTAIANVSCTFNTTSYSEGSSIVFRNVPFAVSGPAAISSNSATRYIDNTAPTVNAISFTNTRTAPDGKAWYLNNNATGDTTITANFAVSTDVGSGANTGQGLGMNAGSGKTTTQYTPGPGCSANVAVNGAGTATSRAETNSYGAVGACANTRGAHTLTLTATDPVGNTSAPVTGTYYYDTAAPASPTSGSAVPGGITSTNSWQINWTNPSVSDATRESPWYQHYYRWPLTTTAKNTYGSCLTNGTNCARSGLALPDPVAGTYYYRTWLIDYAGNSDEENNVTVPVYYGGGGGTGACTVK